MPPVEDHAVHPSTIGGEKYGCHNRPGYSMGYYAPDRVYTTEGRFFETEKFIPHLLSVECRYDLSDSDDKCRGCIHQGSGAAYDQMIRSRGT